MRQSHRLVWNAVAIWGANAFRFVPELLLLPYVIRRLGQESYGIFVMAWSLMPVVNLVQVGLSAAVTRHAPAFDIAGDREGLGRLVSTSVVLSGCFGLILGVAAVGLAWVNLLGDSGAGFARGGELWVAFLGMGLLIVLSFPLTPFGGVVHSAQRYDLFAGLKAGAVYLRAGIIVGWFELVGPSLYALVGASVVVPLVSSFLLVVLARRLSPGLKVRVSLFDRGEARRTIGFAAAIMLNSLSLAAGDAGAKWMMGTSVSTAFVSKMAVMLFIPKMIAELVQAMTLSVMPAASRYSALSDDTMQRELFVRGTRYTTLVVLAAILCVIGCVDDFLGIWMGPEYVYLAPYIVVMSMGTAVWMSTSVSFHVLRGVGREKLSLAAEFTGAVVVRLGVMAGLLAATGLHVWAVALGWAGGQVVTAVMRLVFCAREVNCPLRRVVVRAFLEPLAAAVPAGLALAGVRLVAGVKGLVWGALASVGAVVLFAVLFAAVFMSREDWSLMRSLLSAVGQRVRPLLGISQRGGE